MQCSNENNLRRWFLFGCPPNEQRLKTWISQDIAELRQEIIFILGLTQHLGDKAEIAESQYHKLIMVKEALDDRLAIINEFTNIDDWVDTRDSIHDISFGGRGSDGINELINLLVSINELKKKINKERETYLTLYKTEDELIQSKNNLQMIMQGCQNTRVHAHPTLKWCEDELERITTQRSSVQTCLNETINLIMKDQSVNQDVSYFEGQPSGIENIIMNLEVMKNLDPRGVTNWFEKLGEIFTSATDLKQYYIELVNVIATFKKEYEKWEKVKPLFSQIQGDFEKSVHQANYASALQDICGWIGIEINFPQGHQDLHKLNKTIDDILRIIKKITPNEYFDTTIWGQFYPNKPNGIIGWTLLFKKIRDCYLINSQKFQLSASYQHWEIEISKTATLQISILFVECQNKIKDLNKKAEKWKRLIIEYEEARDAMYAHLPWWVRIIDRDREQTEKNRYDNAKSQALVHAPLYHFPDDPQS